ncbi:di-trans,poly-cis-decaprenylcistransferase [Candidatus Poribacteria bacterium]|nr:di-trans,poly-cis-decaprenylcistransferase [Candidatus Poribacteria bacterium]
MIVPEHIGFIMDGNGRWARERGLSRNEGHRAGIDHIREVLEICHELGIQIVSAYLWSTENWSRPSAETRHIMHCIRMFDPKLAKDLHAKQVRIIHSGNRQNLSRAVLRVIDNAVPLTRENGPRVLNLVFNYGGRAELVHVVRQWIALQVQPEKITETTINNYLYTAGLPDVDLIIRSGGDQRISNFLLWQSAYALVYVARTYWPALSRSDIEEAIKYYNRELAKR